MSLSDDVRSELSAIDPVKPCCRLAELSALARTGGSIHFRGGGRVSIDVRLSSAPVARRAFSLLRSYGVPCEVRTYRQQAFERSTRFELYLEDDARALQALNEAGVLDLSLAPLEQPPVRVIARSCCRAAYLRGVLLAAGSVTGPPNPHLEFRLPDRERARFVSSVAAEDDVELAIRSRGSHAIAYAKGRERITELLAFMGANEAALAFEEDAVVSATRSAANRLANADHANLKRSSLAAVGQLRAINKLQANGDLARLDPKLQELASLRLEHPTVSLAELGKLCRPPAPKPTVHRRLRKLQRLAET